MNPRYFEEAIETAQLLSTGKIILYPTDTIWGLGCSIHFKNSISRIYEIKGRDIQKSPILLVSSLEMLNRYIHRIHPRIDTLLSYHQRPLTVIFPKTKDLPDEVLASDGSVAIRICQDPFCKIMIEALNAPILSTSANLSNEPSPRIFTEISESIKQNVDYIVRHRQNEMTEGVASTIIRYDKDGEIIVLRE
ncbi:MAG: threonylcarbamoyl-AMP synthase [Saprospiraceae bacterium]|nr:threonylcarbamoyl-AMP synthase [Saprospiraceae bacterium]